jgi:hypothetical protein
MNIAEKLVNRSFIHTMTGEDSKTTSDNNEQIPIPDTGLIISDLLEQNPSTYLAATRYTANVFYGVVINTGVFQKSIAGYNQYLVYENSYSRKIDTSKAGMVKV